MVSFYRTVLHRKIAVKNKTDYFTDFAYCELFLERNSRDERGFTVLIFLESQRLNFCFLAGPLFSLLQRNFPTTIVSLMMLAS